MRIVSLWLLPSAWGFVTWSFWLVAYLSLSTETPERQSIYLYLGISALFLTSIVIHRKKARATFALLRKAASGSIDMTAIWMLFIIGLFGVFVHLFALGEGLHGMGYLFMSLLSESHTIRWENAEVTSAGVQLSYLGWISSGLACWGLGRRLLRSRWIFLPILTILANMVFVDRTRPFWIVCTGAAMFLVGALPRLELRKFGLALVASLSILILLFAGVGQWSGKISARGSADSLSVSTVEHLATYGTAGFAYLDRVTSYYTSPDYIPRRTFYPFYRALSALGLASPPPSPILEFESVPHEVNVGTFLEPLYADGGMLYLVIGAIVIVLGSDRLGLYLLRSPSAYAALGWAALCFASSLAFFSSHFASTPCWGLVIVAILSSRGKRTSDENFGANTVSAYRG